MQHATLLRSIWVVLLYAASVPLSQAVILEDFQFNDPNGTELQDAENSANPGNNWLQHSNTVESFVNDGAFRLQKESAAFQANNVLNLSNPITSGTAWLVAEFGGWNYSEIPSSPSERIRIGFLDNSPASTGSSTVTAMFNIDRNAQGDGLFINGEALGSGSTNIAGGFPMSLQRSEPLTVALELDKVANQYSIFYKDNTDPFALLGTGNLGEKLGTSTDIRDGNAMRFAFTGVFGDQPDEFFDVSRIYLTTESPFVDPAPPINLTLEIQANGNMAIVNRTSTPISFDSYRITSSTGDLNLAGWNSLSSQGVDAVGSGTNPGETWTEAGGSDNTVLAESFLLGSTTLGQNDARSLGSAFQVGGDVESLEFEYRNTTTGVVVLGLIDEVVSTIAADFNGDGVVDGSDFLTWQRGFGLAGQTDNSNGDANGDGVVNGADLAVWQSEFGTGAPLLAATQAVPEPTSISLFLLNLALILGRRRFR